uniref:Uncharacterized protein n=1 Tax=Nelumbo nucifera TaxID=4432 RepID=A0A822Z651_NELNU|nr:TPA_asm: hypothetical protein HUJ06_013181 [Nelumbo nucifera]
MCTNPPRTSKHNPSFSALMGHVGLVEGGGFVPGSPLPPPKGGVTRVTSVRRVRGLRKHPFAIHQWRLTH